MVRKNSTCLEMSLLDYVLIFNFIDPCVTEIICFYLSSRWRWLTISKVNTQNNENK